MVRTDRTMVFYEKQENLSKLWDILAVYAWIDKEVGYGQGSFSCKLATNNKVPNTICNFSKLPILTIHNS